MTEVETSLSLAEECAKIIAPDGDDGQIGDPPTREVGDGDVLASQKDRVMDVVVTVGDTPKDQLFDAPANVAVTDSINNDKTTSEVQEEPADVVSPMEISEPVVEEPESSPPAVEVSRPLDGDVENVQNDVKLPTIEPISSDPPIECEKSPTFDAKTIESPPDIEPADPPSVGNENSELDMISTETIPSEDRERSNIKENASAPCEVVEVVDATVSISKSEDGRDSIPTENDNPESNSPIDLPIEDPDSKVSEMDVDLVDDDSQSAVEEKKTETPSLGVSDCLILSESKTDAPDESSVDVRQASPVIAVVESDATLEKRFDDPDIVMEQANETVESEKPRARDPEDDLRSPKIESKTDRSETAVEKSSTEDVKQIFRAFVDFEERTRASDAGDRLNALMDRLHSSEAKRKSSAITAAEEVLDASNRREMSNISTEKEEKPEVSSDFGERSNVPPFDKKRTTAPSENAAERNSVDEKEKTVSSDEDKNCKPEDLTTIDHRVNKDGRSAERPSKDTNGIPKKRSRDDVKSETVTPSKKLRKHLLHIFPKHNAILTDYIENVCGNSDDQLDKEINSVMNELENLRRMTHAKELEWNNLIHNKKAKEELLIRLLRKRKVLSLEGKIEDVPAEETKAVFKDIANDLRADDEAASLDRKTPVSAHQYNLMIPPPPSSCSSGSPLNMVTASQPDKQNYQYYGNKKIVPKPVVMMPPGQRPPNIYELNGLGYNMPMGRQGPIKDVQSIIADYRQRHPEVVPRRGRRMKSSSMHNPQIAPGPRPAGPQDPGMVDLSHLLPGLDANHINSPLDPLMAQQSLLLGQQQGNYPNGMSFKDVLVQFANMTGQGGIMGNPNIRLPPPPPYPEVTLHPVNPPQQSSGKGKPSQQQQQQQSNSLLHGILTKAGQSRQDSRFATFSPTLARLLTAPEKVQPAASISPINAQNFLSQNCGEITITPVNTVPNRQPQEVVQLDDFDETEPEDDSADRPLVIDEGTRNDNGNNKESNNGNAVELSENEVPECQGCRKREAQFVCAGCANQWYCSRDCQVAAWDEHSEVCSG